MEGSCEYINNQSRTAENGWYPRLGVRRGAKHSSPLKKQFIKEISRNWTDYFYMRWAGHIPLMVESVNVKGRDHSEDMEVDGKILGWILGK
jgi:hypothetical protein